MDGDDRIRVAGVEHVAAPAAPVAGPIVPTMPAGKGTARTAVPPTFNVARDRVRWAAVWAGLFVTLTSMLLLTLLGAALGLTAWSPGSEAGSGPLPGPAARHAALWAGLAAVLAFFLGGVVAGGTAAVFSRGWGALNGVLVFMVGLPLPLWLAASGVGSLLGIVGEYAGAVGLDPSRVANAPRRRASRPWGPPRNGLPGVSSAGYSSRSGQPRSAGPPPRAAN